MSDKTVTVDTFMADRGHPYMTLDARTAAEAEWARWEKHIVTGGCPRYATFESRPENGNFEDYTHACDDHVGVLLGHRADAPAPSHYEVRSLVGDEAKSHWCCANVAASKRPQIEILAEMIKRFDDEGEWPLFYEGLRSTVRDLVRVR